MIEENEPEEEKKIQQMKGIRVIERDKFKEENIFKIKDRAICNYNKISSREYYKGLFKTLISKIEFGEEKEIESEKIIGKEEKSSKETDQNYKEIFKSLSNEKSNDKSKSKEKSKEKQLKMEEEEEKENNIENKEKLNLNKIIIDEKGFHKSPKNLKYLENDNAPASNYDLTNFFSQLIKSNVEEENTFKRSYTSFSNKNQMNFSKILKDDDENEFLNEINKKVKTNCNKEFLWGEKEEYKNLKPKFSKSNEIFNFKNEEEEIITTDNNVEKKKFKLKNMILKKAISYNDNLLDLKKIFHCPKEDLNNILIDLNDTSLFYNEVHGKILMQRNKELKLQKKNYLNQLNLMKEDKENEENNGNMSLMGDRSNNFAESERKTFNERISNSAFSETDSLTSKMIGNSSNQLLKKVIFFFNDFL